MPVRRDSRHKGARPARKARSVAKDIAPLPMSPEELSARGWDRVDVVFVTGDAYIDHPSFAMALLGRALEAAGFRVAILSQPDWRSCEPWRQFGRPELFFAISAGNMDSMINHFTANKKIRNSDAYSPGGRIGLRPDRATLVYCQRAREAFPGVVVVAGGVEASLRRLAHYDYWSDSVKRSILMDSKADVLVYGMGERAIVEIAGRLKAGQSVRDLREMRGLAFVLGASEVPSPEQAAETLPSLLNVAAEDLVVLPPFDEFRQDKLHFARATRLIHLNTNPQNAATLVQFHGRRAVVVRPPPFPLSEKELDAIYALSFTRRPHPIYEEPVPAFDMIKDSVTIMRGCFGGCSFCSISAHQGRTVQSRSPESILREVRTLVADPDFGGLVSDVGGPTANMYRMGCTSARANSTCRRLSCLFPDVCGFLNTGHEALLALLARLRGLEGVRKLLVSSGVRMDLALRSPEYIHDLVAYHVGGHLKVAPEHTDNEVLKLMHKGTIDSFLGFAETFGTASRAAGKTQQYLVPYFMAGHPGTDLESMIALAVFLKRTGYRPRQVQDFVPAPFDIATCMYYTGVDPMSGREVYVPRGQRERRLQRALLQFFKPENYFDVRSALEEAGRRDLIGLGEDALIPPAPSAEALRARRARAHEAAGTSKRGSAKTHGAADTSHQRGQGAGEVSRRDRENGGKRRGGRHSRAVGGSQTRSGYRPHKK